MHMSVTVDRGPVCLGVGLLVLCATALGLVGSSHRWPLSPFLEGPKPVSLEVLKALKGMKFCSQNNFGT